MPLTDQRMLYQHNESESAAMEKGSSQSDVNRHLCFKYDGQKLIWANLVETKTVEAEGQENGNMQLPEVRVGDL